MAKAYVRRQVRGLRVLRCYVEIQWLDFSVDVMAVSIDRLDTEEP